MKNRLEKQNSLPLAWSRTLFYDVQEQQHAGCVTLSWSGTGTGRVEVGSVQLLAQAQPPVPQPFHG